MDITSQVSVHFGGNRGCYTNSWTSSCYTQFERCCFNPGAMGGDFGMGNHSGASYREAMVGTVTVSITTMRCSQEAHLSEL